MTTDTGSGGFAPDTIETLQSRLATSDRALAEAKDVVARFSMCIAGLKEKLDDERAAHERTRAELAIQRDMVAEAIRSQNVTADSLATAQARVAEAAERTETAQYKRLLGRALAAESALASARKLLGKWTYALRTYGNWPHDETQLFLSTTPLPNSDSANEPQRTTPAPSEPEVMALLVEWLDDVNNTSPVRGRSVLAERTRALIRTKGAPGKSVAQQAYPLTDVRDAEPGAPADSPSEPVEVTEERELLEEASNCMGVDAIDMCERIDAWLSAHPKPEAQQER